MARSATGVTGTATVDWLSAVSGSVTSKLCTAPRLLTAGWPVTDGASRPVTVTATLSPAVSWGKRHTSSASVHTPEGAAVVSAVTVYPGAGTSVSRIVVASDGPLLRAVRV